MDSVTPHDFQKGMPPAAAAVKALRKRLKLSQQAFATELGLSIRAITNYEGGRNPTGKALFRLADLAHKSGFYDLSDTLSHAFNSELEATFLVPDNHLDFRSTSERELGRAVLLTLREPRYKKQIPKLETALRPALDEIQARKKRYNESFNSDVVNDEAGVKAK